MKQILLTEGYLAIVDDEDYELLMKYVWITDKRKRTCYAVAWVRENGEPVKRSMHRFLLNPPKGLVVDHVNHNGLDNRRSNIRVTTQSENRKNSRRWQDKPDSYTYVRWYKQRNKWRVMVGHKYVGLFDDLVCAITARDKFINQIVVS